MALKMIAEAGSGHIGPSFSCADIITCLYSGIMKITPSSPDAPDRDRLILSKGHGVPTLYACLALKGFFPPTVLKQFRQINSPLQATPDVKRVAGIDAGSGSLGQGLSQALGMCLALKYQNISAHVYTILGDGELQEGQVWEAAQAIAHFNPGNLTAIIDFNKMQLDGNAIISEPLLAEKWRAFGWHVEEVNGHSHGELSSVLSNRTTEKPLMVIAHTIKGKGVSFMEGNPAYHAGVPPQGIIDEAISQLMQSSL